jgi:flagellar M-ring protein FliF
VQSVIEALQRFGIGRLAAILGVAAGVAAALFALVLNVGTQPKALLYANLDLKEAGQITQALDQSGIKYEVKGDGSTIMVPRDKVASTRIMLSSKGMPTSGSVGYEIFDSASPLGQTDFIQNLNRQRALEGELARTIRSLQGVSSARVHLVLPRRQLFENDGEAPSASVVIGVAGRAPGADQVAAVRNLIAGAVPNLKPDRVTVVDERGKLLAGVGDGDGQGSAADTLRTDTEERMRKTIKDLVEGVVGAGKARVQVTADLDRNRVTLQDDKYDPDGQVVRSTQTVNENAKQSQAAGTTGATATANIPGGATGTTPAEPGNSSDSGRAEETTNYEISHSTRTEVQEPGQVKRLSVAVAVDGVTTIGPKGKVSYAPRPADEMKKIEDLVRSAVGYSAQRGDVVSVVNVRFDHGDEEGTAAGNPLVNFDKNDMMRMAELGVLLVMAGLVVFFVVRPLLSTAAGGGAPRLPMMLAGSTAGVPSGPALTISGAAEPQGGGGGVNMVKTAPAIPDPRIDIAKIEGAVKVSSVKQVSEFVDNHPEESVSILRAWLHESA